MNGHWIFTVQHYKGENLFLSGCWSCSECNHASFDSARFPSQEFFCHNCGAKMDAVPELKIEEFEYKAKYSWE